MRIGGNNGGFGLDRGGSASQVGTGSSVGSSQQGANVISLSKGQRISLTKETPNLDKILVGLGWDTNEYNGPAYDLDAAVFMLGQNGRVPSNDFFIFYNQLSSPEGSIVHTGDNLTGEGEGDDESLKVVLSKVPAHIERIVFTVTIHEALQRNQSFGQVKNAFIRIVDETTGGEVIRFDLTEDFSSETSVVAGELYRHNGEWRFTAVGQGFTDTLGDFCNRYGVAIG